MAAACLSNLTLRVRCSYDLFPNPVTIPAPGTKKTLTKKKPSIPPKKVPAPVSDLFIKLNSPTTSPGKTEEKQYMGYDVWLPVAPKVNKPRSIYNAASLAYIGDCVYELYARRHFLFPPHSIEEFNDRVKAVVRCETQDLLLKKLLEDDYLTEEERDVLRWGKNIISGKTKTRKRAGGAVYSRASSLEALVGFLYLTDMERLEDLMMKLGFKNGASDEQIGGKPQ